MRLAPSLPLALALAGAAPFAVARAQSQPEPSNQPASATSSSPAAGSSGDGATVTDPHKKALLKEIQQYATPDQHHQVLKALVGKWTTIAKHWSDGPKPERVTGHDQAEAILDGRFIEDHYDSIVWGKRYTGQGTLGYDLREQQYVLAWVDNWGTWITVAKGSGDATNHIITLSTRDYDNPAGKTRPVKYIITIDDNDRHSRKVYEKIDGKETLTMEIEYRRTK
jgi:hypothetical protein